MSTGMRVFGTRLPTFRRNLLVTFQKALIVKQGPLSRILLVTLPRLFLSTFILSFVIYLTMLSVSRIIWRWMIAWTVNNELQKIWSWSNVGYYLRICLKVQRKPTKYLRISSLRDRISKYDGTLTTLCICKKSPLTTIIFRNMYKYAFVRFSNTIRPLKYKRTDMYM